MTPNDAIAELESQGLTGDEAAIAFAGLTGQPCLSVYQAFDRSASNVNVHIHHPDGRHEVVGTDLEDGDPDWSMVEGLFVGLTAAYAAEESSEGSEGTAVMPLADFVAAFKTRF